jgi:hypothetical protein
MQRWACSVAQTLLSDVTQQDDTPHHRSLTLRAMSAMDGVLFPQVREGRPGYAIDSLDRSYDSLEALIASHAGEEHSTNACCLWMTYRPAAVLAISTPWNATPAALH